jgi:hypothetical protein
MEIYAVDCKDAKIERSIDRDEAKNGGRIEHFEHD